LLQDVDWGELDVLFIDLPPGTAEPHATLVRERLLHGVVVVTTPQEVAQVDAGRFLRYFAAAGVPVLGAVLNMSHFICPDCGGRHAIWPRRDVPGGALEQPVLAEVPLAPAIAVASDAGRPIVATAPASEVARAFLTAADRLWERLAGEAAAGA
jgi:ATP-binding protein involved in chromosome partitioning